MSIFTVRRGTSVLLSTALLLIGVLSLAPQASAQTLYACIKKNGSARVYVKKPKCKKGESKISWNSSGLAGKNGANGAPGLAGALGPGGPKGAEGPSGASLKPLVPLAGTLENAWSEGGGFGTPSFAKDASGVVHLLGSVVHSGASSAVIFTLPVGFRPKYDIDEPVAFSFEKVGVLRLNPDGTVEPISGTTTFVDLEGVTFFAG